MAQGPGMPCLELPTPRPAPAPGCSALRPPRGRPRGRLRGYRGGVCGQGRSRPLSLAQPSQAQPSSAQFSPAPGHGPAQPPRPRGAAPGCRPSPGATVRAGSRGGTGGTLRGEGGLRGLGRGGAAPARRPPRCGARGGPEPRSRCAGGRGAGGGGEPGERLRFQSSESPSAPRNKAGS